MKMRMNRKILVVVLSLWSIFLIIKSLPRLQGLLHLASQHAQYNIQHMDAGYFTQLHTDLKKPPMKVVSLSQIHPNQVHNDFSQPQKKVEHLNQTSNRYRGRLSFNCDGRVERDKSKPTLVLGILSSTKHTALRNIHRTSLKIYKSYPLNVILCFMVDKPTPGLLEESKLHKDMVFLNTTSEGWGKKFGEKLYKWFVFVNTTFSNVTLVGKMDDDVFLCLPEVFERLKIVANLRLYYGFEVSGKNAFKFFVRPDRRKLVKILTWVDEMFVVVGKSLVKRIIERKFCFDNSPLCDPLVDLVDSRYASDSLKLWLLIYPDVKIVSDNKYIIHFGNTRKFQTRDFCKKYILMHPMKSPTDISQMYNYTWNKSGVVPHT